METEVLLSEAEPLTCILLGFVFVIIWYWLIGHVVTVAILAVTACSLCTQVRVSCSHISFCCILQSSCSEPFWAGCFAVLHHEWDKCVPLHCPAPVNRLHVVIIGQHMRHRRPSLWRRPTKWKGGDISIVVVEQTSTGCLWSASSSQRTRQTFPSHSDDRTTTAAPTGTKVLLSIVCSTTIIGWWVWVSVAGPIYRNSNYYIMLCGLVEDITQFWWRQWKPDLLLFPASVFWSLNGAIMYQPRTTTGCGALEWALQTTT